MNIAARRSLPTTPPDGFDADRLVALSLDLLGLVGRDGRFAQVNPAFERTLGWTADELLARPYLALVHPDDHARTEAAVRALTPGTSPASLEHRVRSRDGAYRIIAWRMARHDEDGPLHLAGRDVTMQQVADDARHVQATLLDAVGCAVVATDLAGTVTFSNAAAGVLFGWRPEEVLGRSVLDFAPAAQSRQEAEAILAHLREGQFWAGELVLRRRDGSSFHAHVVNTPVLDDRGALIGVVGVSVDVSERRLAEATLRRQNEVLQVMFDHIPAMVTLTHADGRAAYVNREWVRVTGWSIEDIRSRDVLPELYPDAAERARVSEFMRAATGETEDFRMRVRDGRVRDMVWAVIRLSDGAIVGLGLDITERRQLEAEIRQAHKMEAVGRLASGVAHDFNNLLQVITGGTLFAREELAPDHPARAELATIDEAAARAGALTRQLLAFGRRQVLKPEPLDVNRIVTDVERMLRRALGADIALATRLEPGLGAVLADAGQLEQVLMNLALNARDAMPEGGTLTMETHARRLDAADARHGELTPGPYLALRVRDTGVGMDEATRERVFEPFFSTKELGRGTGLGLSTVYGIVTQSGGRVHVESAPGAGSTFTVLLPMLAGAAPQVADAPPVRAVHGTESILLVEHEVNVRVAVRRMLERGGYAVIEASRATEALRLVAEPGRRVDLVLSDVVMPEMDVGALVAHMRAHHPDTRILLMSGYGRDARVRQATLGDQVELITKPFAPDDLLRRVRAALDGPQRLTAR